DTVAMKQNDPQAKSLFLQTLDKEINTLSGTPEIDADEPFDLMGSLKKMERPLQPVKSPRHPLRVLVALALLVAIGIVGGGFYYIASNEMYLMCMSPLVAAAVTGYLAFHITKFSTVRAKPMAFLLGTLIGLTLTGTYHELRYQDFLGVVRADI